MWGLTQAGVASSRREAGLRSECTPAAPCADPSLAALHSPSPAPRAATSWPGQPSRESAGRPGRQAGTPSHHVFEVPVLQCSGVARPADQETATEKSLCSRTVRAGLCHRATREAAGGTGGGGSQGQWPQEPPRSFPPEGARGEAGAGEDSGINTVTGPRHGHRPSLCVPGQGAGQGAAAPWRSRLWGGCLHLEFWAL